MHNNYYFLKELSKRLSQKLIGLRLATCFSQNKNELILGFASNQDEFYIKAHLDPSFCCLYFPEDFQRARKNSIDLFEEVIDQEVTDLKQFLNERCFALIFSNGQRLLFKMQGNRSNIILCSADGSVMKLFNSKLKNDWNIDINTLDRPLDQSHKSFLENDGDVKKLYPTFGKVIKMYLKQQSYYQMPIDKQWNALKQMLQKLDKPEYYIAESNGTLNFSLLPIGEIKDQFKDPITAINSFFVQYVSTESIQLLKKQVLSQVDKVIDQSKSYLKKTQQKLESLKHATDYSQQADILMANLHQISTEQSTVTLQNFYDSNASITIKLKKHLSPQKNAEVYYRKAKNQAIELKNLEGSISAKGKLIATYEKLKSEIIPMDDFKTLKNYLKEHDMVHDHKSINTTQYPFSQYIYNGFTIWIGKNAKNNDKMLQGHTFKEDLWLHAKDVSGSHVIIKYQSGKNFPKNVIEYAAQLAAYHSKRKTDSLCPVIVTPRKYVRKRKGDPAGAVVVDQEDVIMVEPKKPVS